jgi:hypothetical protein
MRGTADVMLHFLDSDDAWMTGTPSLSSTIEPSYVEVAGKIPLIVTITQAEGRRYYFWFFGYVAELPYETTFNPPRPQSFRVEADNYVTTATETDDVRLVLRDIGRNTWPVSILIAVVAFVCVVVVAVITISSVRKRN